MKIIVCLLAVEFPLIVQGQLHGIGCDMVESAGSLCYEFTAAPGVMYFWGSLDDNSR